MALRDGMTDLVARLRSLCDAGTADYTIGATTYWTDDHLQDALDGQRADIRREPLMVSPEVVAGNTTEYHDYLWRGGGDVETVESGSAAWLVMDGAGSAYGTADYTPSYRAQRLRFSSDTEGKALYLSYRAYDLERAAADVWEQKAAHVSSRFDIKTDNHTLSRSQLRRGYLDMAALHRKRAPARSIRRVRDDVNPMPVEGTAVPGWWKN